MVKEIIYGLLSDTCTSGHSISDAVPEDVSHLECKQTSGESGLQGGARYII